MTVKSIRKRVDRRSGQIKGPLFHRVKQRQHCFRQTRQIPLGTLGLIAIGIASAMIDRAENGRWVVRFHEGTWAVVDGFAGERHVIGIHDSMNKPDEHPAGDERRLAFDDGFEKGEVGVGRTVEFRVMAFPGVVGECLQGDLILAGGGPFKCTGADVTGGDAGQHGAGQRLLAHDRLAGGGHC